MSVDRMVFAFAGSFVLIGVVLAWWVSAWGLLVPAFGGVQVVQAAIRGCCRLEKILRSVGVKPGAAF